MQNGIMLYVSFMNPFQALVLLRKHSLADMTKMCAHLIKWLWPFSAQ